MKRIFLSVLAFILMAGFGLEGPYAQTSVTSITPSPAAINPFKNETTTITVEASPGAKNLEVQILSQDQSTVIRSGLKLTESPAGVYTATWNGRNDVLHEGAREVVVEGAYVARVYNTQTSSWMGAPGSVSVESFQIELPSAGESFVSTGRNQVTFTVKARPKQSSLRVYLDSYEDFAELPLEEASEPGVYQARWNAVQNGFIAPNGNWSVGIGFEEGAFFPTSGRIKTASVENLVVTPDPFSVSEESPLQVTVTAQPDMGLNLKIYAVPAFISPEELPEHSGLPADYHRGPSWLPLRTISLTGTATGYTGQWDGKDDAGQRSFQGIT